MKIKLKDTLHFSDIRREPFVAGDKVDLPDRQAKDLIDRGLATPVASAPKRAAKAQGPAPKNKAEGRSPATKSASAAPRIIGR